MLILGIDKIFNFVGATVNSQNMKLGQEFLISNFVFKCGVSARFVDKVYLYASVLQTIGLGEKPHRVTGLLLIDKKKDVSIERMYCKCFKLQKKLKECTANALSCKKLLL